VILAFLSAVINPVGGFITNDRRITLIPRTRSYRELSTPPVNQKGRAKVFRVADDRRIRLIQSEGGQGHPKSSSSPSSLYSSSSIESSSPRGKTTVVYLLILASVLSFVGDNIIHLPVFQTLYMYHRKWRWWQPITSTFCHVDKSHLSGNVFLLLIFGRSVEDELGPIGLLFSYIFCGVMANFVSLAMLPKNTVGLGASGAIFGLFSISICSRLSWGDVLDWRKLIEVGVLGQFVVNQFFNEAKTVAAGGISGVNHVVHLSGAGAGVAMILILRKLINRMEEK